MRPQQLLAFLMFGTSKPYSSRKATGPGTFMMTGIPNSLADTVPAQDMKSARTTSGLSDWIASKTKGCHFFWNESVGSSHIFDFFYRSSFLSPHSVNTILIPNFSANIFAFSRAKSFPFVMMYTSWPASLSAVAQFEMGMKWPRKLTTTHATFSIFLPWISVN